MALPMPSVPRGFDATQGGPPTRPDGPARSRDWQTKATRLRECLGQLGAVVVAYSGGVDSTLVAAVAVEVLGPKAQAITGDSAALDPAERTAAAELAARLGIAHRFVTTHEIDAAGYIANGADRCWHCKTELYRRLSQAIATDAATAIQQRREWTQPVIVNGTNLDDLGDHRPGLAAATAAGVVSPLVEAGLTKADVRAISEAMGLPTAHKPANPCLASRLPYGTPVDRQSLAMVAAAEGYLRSLGLTELRVRHHGRLARVEVPDQAIAALAEPTLRAAIVGELRRLGYAWVTLDLEGFRSGGNNRVLDRPDLAIGLARGSASNAAGPPGQPPPSSREPTPP